ncbi:MAG: class I SAM-dependent methyltransferase [Haloferacaceae archaeon]
MSPITEPFEAHTDRYEEWFERYEPVYRAELAALDRLIDAGGESDADGGGSDAGEHDESGDVGVEVGVGTGRFAEPLGIEYGVDPSLEMLQRARRRGVEVVGGVAEALPLADDSVDLALLVTTVCFVDDLAETFAEARRVLRPDGRVVLGYVDSESPVGRQYRELQDENPFYRDATFVSTDELREVLSRAGFRDFRFVQTVFDRIEEIGPDEPVRDGYGEGSFVGLAARTPPRN